MGFDFGGLGAALPPDWLWGISLYFLMAVGELLALASGKWTNKKQQSIPKGERFR